MTLESYFLVFSTGTTNLIQPETCLEIRLDQTEPLSFDSLKVSQALDEKLEVSRVSGLHTWLDKPILVSLAPLFLRLL